ncbi:MAG: GNAT family N-acetyltransferase [Acidimicrobiales bacterium]
MGKMYRRSSDRRDRPATMAGREPSLELRPVSPEEVPAFLRAVDAAFSHYPTDDELAPEIALFEPERSLAAFEGQDMVGTAGAKSIELTLPGAPPVVVPAAGVSYVGVLPTHRRRGVLSHLMRAQLDELHARGEAMAALVASEGAIYGRFGYGVASNYLGVTIRRSRSAFSSGTGEDDGRVRLLDAEAAAKVLPALHDAARRAQPGDVDRSPAWWVGYFGHPGWWVANDAPRHFVVHEDGEGRADGYAIYKVTYDENLPDDEGEMLVREVVGSAGAQGALWRYLLDVDLIPTVRARKLPLDDPLRHRLADPRGLEVDLWRDDLWVRPVDAVGALGARRYPTGEARVTIEVLDAFCPWNTGRLLLDVERGGQAAVRRDSSSADLTLGPAELGTLLLGATPASVLARAGRVDEHRPGALAVADALFGCDPLPYCRTGF